MGLLASVSSSEVTLSSVSASTPPEVTSESQLQESLAAFASAVVEDDGGGIIAGITGGGEKGEMAPEGCEELVWS